jgi:anti-sigma regulatory factor (Ser/Thr protein kinase)
VDRLGQTSFSHPALFYRDADEYAAAAAAFVRAGLAGSEPVAVAAPPASLDLIRAALDGDAAQVTMIDMTEAGRNPGRILPAVLLAFADDHRDQRVRIIGEPIWPGRTDTEYPACVQHEALINLAFADRKATILCPYDAAGLPEQVLADACVTHPVVIDADGERASAEYDVDAALNVYSAPFTDDRPNGTGLIVSADNLTTARAYALFQARRAGLPDNQAHEVEVVVSELATNSVQHGGGRGTLRVWIADGQLVCELQDAGTITDPLAGRRPVPDHAARGRGLLLANHLTDLVRIHTGADGTTVRVHVNLPR